MSASSCLSVCPSVARNNSKPTGRTDMKYDTGNFHQLAYISLIWFKSGGGISDTLHNKPTHIYGFILVSSVNLVLR